MARISSSSFFFFFFVFFWLFLSGKRRQGAEQAVFHLQRLSTVMLDAWTRAEVELPAPLSQGTDCIADT
jgi:membrane-bound metal-dependent hydrolase YbcI (DUF457 family)